MFLAEFKKFIMRGNVLDMAVGIVVGAAFSKIVSSFVSNILMPPLGLLIGRVDFSNLFINLSSQKVHTLTEAQAANVPVIAYGVFLNTVIDFLIVSFAIFIVIKQVNRFVVWRFAAGGDCDCGGGARACAGGGAAECGV